MILFPMLFLTHDYNFQNDVSQRVLGVTRTSAPRLQCIFSYRIHFRSNYECLSILRIDLSELKSSQVHQMSEYFRKIRYFSLNFIEFHWFLMIFVGFHWFCCNCSEILVTVWWHWAIQVSPGSSQIVLKHSKLESSCKNTLKLWCGSPLNSKYSQRWTTLKILVVCQK